MTTAPQEADEVAAAKDAVLVAAFRAYSVPQGYNGAQFAALMDAFERAVEADLFRRAAVAAERFDLTDAKLPPHMRAETLLAEWMARAKAAEARAETSDMAANAAIDVVAEYRERLSRLEAAAREVVEHSPVMSDWPHTTEQMQARLRAALKAGE